MSVDDMTNEQLADLLRHFTDGMREDITMDMPHDQFQAACLVVAILDRAIQIVREA